MFKWIKQQFFCEHEFAFVKFGYNTIGDDWFDRLGGIKPFTYPCEWRECVKCDKMDDKITLESTRWEIRRNSLHPLHDLITMWEAQEQERKQKLH